MALVGGGEKLDSHNLRDFLRIKDDDRRSNLNSTSVGGSNGHNPSGLTLLAILREKRSTEPSSPADEPPLQRAQSNRTLLDIIREDQTSGPGAVDGAVPRNGWRSWRQLREKIGLRTRGGSAFSSTVPVPTSDAPIGNSNREMIMITGQPSTRFDPNIDLAESTRLDPSPEHARERFERISSSSRGRLIAEDNRRHIGEEEERDGVGAAESGQAEQPVRMSLMALLAENNRQMEFEGSAYVLGDGEGEGEENDALGGAGGYNGCCVCMVRRKGAAFIPCGHTFCRLCSRELWVQRANCPLCNNYILEILDIF